MRMCTSTRCLGHWHREWGLLSYSSRLPPPPPLPRLPPRSPRVAEGGKDSSHFDLTKGFTAAMPQAPPDARELHVTCIMQCFCIVFSPIWSAHYGKLKNHSAMPDLFSQILKYTIHYFRPLHVDLACRGVP